MLELAYLHPLAVERAAARMLQVRSCSRCSAGLQVNTWGVLARRMHVNAHGPHVIKQALVHLLLLAFGKTVQRVNGAF